MSTVVTPAEGEDQPSPGRELPGRSERLSWTDLLRRVLLAVCTSVAAALVAELLGADTLPAVVLGAALPQLIEHLAQRLEPRTRTLAVLATLLGLAYGRDWVRDRLAGAAPSISGALATGVTIVAGGMTVAAIDVTEAIADRPPASLSGTWQTTAFRVEQQSGLTSGEPTAPERWTITRAPGCAGSKCGYRATIPGRGTVTLTPAKDRTFVGTTEGHADCVENPPSDRVTVEAGYDDHWTYRVAPRPSAVRRPTGAKITLTLDSTATPAAIAQDCRARVTATYVSTAIRVR